MLGYDRSRSRFDTIDDQEEGRSKPVLDKDRKDIFVIVDETVVECDQDVDSVGRKPDDRAALVEMNRIVFLLNENDLALEFCGRQRIWKRGGIRHNVVVNERPDFAAIPMSQRPVDAHKMDGHQQPILEVGHSFGVPTMCVIRFAMARSQ